MGKWEMARLGDYIKQIRGVSYKPEDVSENEDGDHVPVLRAHNIQTDGLNFNNLVYVNKQRIQQIQFIRRNDIVVCASSGSKELVGKAAQSSQDMLLSFGAFCKVVRPQKGVNPRYLKHYFNSTNYRKIISDLSSGANISNLRNEHIDELELPLPPLPIQQKIADVLDKASALIEMRKLQIEKLDLLIKSQFIEMFGDLQNNSSKWDVHSFSFVAKIDTKMTTDFKTYALYPHIGIESIEKDTGKILDYKLVKDSDLKSGKYLFDERHLIYSKIRPNLNKLAKPNFRGLCSADAYPLLPTQNSNREFLSQVLRSDFFLDYILAFCGRTNIPKVNKEQLEGFMLPVPPKSLQDKFALIVKQIEEKRALLEQSLKAHETNYQSMMQECFSGEMF